MNNESVNEGQPPGATEDMLTDLGVTGGEAAEFRRLLSDVAGLAHEVPEPSDEVRALLGGAIPLRSRRRLGVVAAAVGALAFGGVSAAAAANRLPEPVQQVVADATGGVLPHPVKPTDPPYDAPGHVINKPKGTATPKPDPARTPKPLKTTAPGQVQKQTKPDPTAPGPAHPADPGSHGRAHNETKLDATDTPRPQKSEHVDSENDEDGDDPGSNTGKGNKD